MKKIYTILALMLVLFGAAYLVYDYNLANEEVVEVAVNETDSNSSLESTSTSESDELVLESASDVSSETNSNSDTQADAEADVDDATESDISQSASLTNGQTNIQGEPQGWQGPDSNYLNQDGDLLNLNENLGKGTLINIWASWCEPCRVEMPYFEEAYQNYGDDINFLMIDALDSRPTETQEAALAFFEEMELSMPIYFDHEMSNQYLFGATILPLTVVLDDEGKVVEIVRGQVSQAKLKQMIEKIR